MTEREKAFSEFLDGLIAREGSAASLAAAIDMANTSLLRAAHQTFTMNTENCLLLAAHVGEDPSKVLRLAGKDEFAALIERLYGASRAPMSGLDRQVLGLSEKSKKLALMLVDAAQEEASARQQTSAEKPAKHHKSERRRTA